MRSTSSLSSAGNAIKHSPVTAAMYSGNRVPKRSNNPSIPFINTNNDTNTNNETDVHIMELELALETARQREAAECKHVARLERQIVREMTRSRSSSPLKPALRNKVAGTITNYNSEDGKRIDLLERKLLELEGQLQNNARNGIINNNNNNNNNNEILELETQLLQAKRETEYSTRVRLQQEAELTQKLLEAKEKIRRVENIEGDMRLEAKDESDVGDITLSPPAQQWLSQSFGRVSMSPDALTRDEELQLLRAKVVALETERGSAMIEARAARATIEALQVRISEYELEQSDLQQELEISREEGRREYQLQLSRSIASAASQAALAESAATAQKLAEDRVRILEEQLREIQRRTQAKQQKEKQRQDENMRLHMQVRELIVQLEKKNRSENNSNNNNGSSSSSSSVNTTDSQKEQQQQQQQQKEEFQRQCAQLQNEVSSLTLELQKAHSDIEELQQRLDEQSHASLLLTNENSELREECHKLEQMRMRMEAVEAERSRLEAQLSRTSATLTDKEALLATAHRNQLDLKKQIESLEASKQSLLTSIAESTPTPPPPPPPTPKPATSEISVMTDTDWIQQFQQQPSLQISQPPPCPSPLRSSSTPTTIPDDMDQITIKRLNAEIEETKKKHETELLDLKKRKDAEYADKLAAAKKISEEAKRKHEAEVRDMNAQMQVRIKNEARNLVEAIKQELSSVQSTLEQRDKELAEAKAKLEESASSPVVDSDQIAALNKILFDKEKEIKDLQSKVDSLEQEVETAKKAAAAAAASSNSNNNKSGTLSVEQVKAREDALKTQYEGEMKKIAEAWRGECDRVTQTEQDKLIAILAGEMEIPPEIQQYLVQLQQQQQQQMPLSPQHVAQQLNSQQQQQPPGQTPLSPLSPQALVAPSQPPPSQPSTPAIATTPTAAANDDDTKKKKGGLLGLFGGSKKKTSTPTSSSSASKSKKVSVVPGDANDDEEMLVITDGTEIEAAELERHIGSFIPFFEHIVVVGSGKSVLGLLASIKTAADGESLSEQALQFAQKVGSPAKTVSEARSDATFQQNVLRLLAEANETGLGAKSPACKVRRFAILAQPLSVQQGTLYDNGTVNRLALKAACKAFVDSLINLGN